MYEHILCEQWHSSDTGGFSNKKKKNVGRNLILANGMDKIDVLVLLKPVISHKLQAQTNTKQKLQFNHFNTSMQK